MNLPETPINVVFKYNRGMNKFLAKDITTIKSSTQMGQLPINTVVVTQNKYCLTYRYVGNHAYNYASIHTWKDSNPNTNNQESAELSGRTDTFEELLQFIETVDRIKPFVSQLYNN